MENSKENCYNCGYNLEQGYSFCKNCGQKNVKSLLGIGEVIKNFIAITLNFDGPFFRSLRLIFKPWKLTSKFVEGKRVPYLHPARLFIVLLLIHFGLLLSVINMDNKNLSVPDHYAKLDKSKMYEQFLAVDSLNPNVISKEAKDTIVNQIFKGVDLPKDDVISLTEIGGMKKDYVITRQDANQLSKDSLFQKYEINSFFDQLVVSQLIKIDTNKAESIRYFIKNFGWSIILIVFILALFFKLMYIRHKKYFVEHVVFWMNVHSSSFFMVILGILIYKVTETEIAFIFGFTPLIFLFLSMLFYFKQSVLKTMVKFMITCLFYSTICLIVGIFFSFASLVFF